MKKRTVTTHKATPNRRSSSFDNFPGFEEAVLRTSRQILADVMQDVKTAIPGEDVSKAYVEKKGQYRYIFHFGDYCSKTSAYNENQALFNGWSDYLRSIGKARPEKMPEPQAGLEIKPPPKYGLTPSVTEAYHLRKQKWSTQKEASKDTLTRVIKQIKAVMPNYYNRSPSAKPLGCSRYEFRWGGQCINDIVADNILEAQWIGWLKYLKTVDQEALGVAINVIKELSKPASDAAIESDIPKVDNSCNLPDNTLLQSQRAFVAPSSKSRTLSPGAAKLANERDENGLPVWIRPPSRGIEFYTGVTGNQLHGWAAYDKIQSVTVRTFGQKNGVRFYSLQSILRYMEEFAQVSTTNDGQSNAGFTNDRSWGRPVWVRAPKKGREYFSGVTKGSLFQLAYEGLIRSASIREPGKAAGSRYFHLQSILDYIERHEEKAPAATAVRVQEGAADGNSLVSSMARKWRDRAAELRRLAAVSTSEAIQARCLTKATALEQCANDLDSGSPAQSEPPGQQP